MADTRRTVRFLMARCLARFMTISLTLGCFLSVPATCQYSCMQCPEYCQCTEWESFYGCYVDCTFRNLDKIPALKVTNTIIFNLSRNHLQHLTGDSFTSSSADIKNLDLSHNLIESIEPQTFKSFQELEVMNLGHNLLISFPEFLPASLKVLELNFNKFPDFDVRVLASYGIFNLKSLLFDFNEIEEITHDSRDLLRSSANSLQEISLRNNKIKSINQLTLAVFRKLKYLSLNDNLLEDVSVEAFKFNSELEVLDLSNNRIRTIFPGTFKSLPHLKYLSLSGNELKLFPPDIPLLEWLDISFNKISKISEENKSKLYPPEVLLLGGNPLHCDCDLLWLKEFYDSREYKLAYLNIETEKFIPVCASPLIIANESWDLLSTELFQCGGAEDKTQTINHVASENTKPSAEESSPIQIKVTEIYENSIKIYWTQYRMPSSVILKFHTSSQRYMEEEIIIEPSQDHPLYGVFLLENLEPNTDYVVCLTVQFKMEFEHVTHSGCLKIRTKGTLSYLQSILNEGFQCSDLVLISLLCVIFGYWLHRLVEMLTTVETTVDKSDKAIN